MTKKELRNNPLKKKDMFQEFSTVEEPEEVQITSEDSTEEVSIISKVMDKKQKKKTVEETHTRTTFLFRNDLKERFEALLGDQRGVKTELFNAIMEEFIEREEKNR